MNALVAVFVGGGIGSLIRYLFYLGVVSLKIDRTWLATLLVNVIGCMLIFFFYKYQIGASRIGSAALRTGLVGGLTTFSTFMFEVMVLSQNGRLKEAGLVFLLNILSGILIGVWILR